MSLILSKEQNKALDLMAQNYKERKQMTVIGGFAGTGKSSIINYFIEQEDLMNKTQFVTFTGKASLVLQKQGLPACTIHKLIYNTYLNKRTNKFYFQLKDRLAYNIKLIVVDEISMVSSKLLNDLKSFRIPIIALGDPGQLEPIGDDNGLLKKPDIFLTKIHRQAENSPIIKLSMLARQGKYIPYIYDNDTIKVIKKEELTTSMLAWADQVLCGKNTTRRTLNSIIRKDKGFTEDVPCVGDKMICLRNYWEEVNDEDYPLINGTIGEVKRSITKGKYGDIYIDFNSDYSYSRYSNLKIDHEILAGRPSKSTVLQKPIKGLFEFDFGYAITVHKSQGSEFDKILIFDEALGGSSHQRWLYTAITRAKSKIVLVK